jgi:pimeloyl-ACP methyl ester carboxylesterase
MTITIDQAAPSAARSAPTRFVEARGRRLAYRMFGEGPPLVLCLRFRGVMDSWDPAFLDALAHDFTVVIFDYTGTGRSTGRGSYAKPAMAGDAADLVDALGLDRVVIGGWSIGGCAAQLFAALHPERVSHVVAIASTPPGPLATPGEPLFLETALHPVNDTADEYILFFEPASPSSRAAADASLARIATRTQDRSPEIAPETWAPMLQASVHPDGPFPDPDGVVQHFFRTTDVPVLALSGDHDIMFPVENWYALNRFWPTLTAVTFPQAGHGPQHQHPELAAEIIASFVRRT